MKATGLLVLCSAFLSATEPTDKFNALFTQGTVLNSAELPESVPVLVELHRTVDGQEISETIFKGEAYLGVPRVYTDVSTFEVPDWGQTQLGTRFAILVTKNDNLKGVTYTLLVDCKRTRPGKIELMPGKDSPVYFLYGETQGLHTEYTARSGQVAKIYGLGDDGYYFLLQVGVPPDPAPEPIITGPTDFLQMKPSE